MRVAKEELAAALRAHGGSYCFEESIRISIPDYKMPVCVKKAYLGDEAPFVFVVVASREDEMKVCGYIDIPVAALCYITNKIPPVEGGVKSVRGVLPIGDPGINPELSFLIGQSVHDLFLEAEVPMNVRWRMIEPLARHLTSRVKSREGIDSTDTRSYFDDYSQESIEKEMKSWRKTIIEDFFIEPLFDIARKAYGKSDDAFIKKVFLVFYQIAHHDVRTLPILTADLNTHFGKMANAAVEKLEEDGFLRVGPMGEVEVSFMNLRGYFK